MSLLSDRIGLKKIINSQLTSKSLKHQELEQLHVKHAIESLILEKFYKYWQKTMLCGLEWTTNSSRFPHEL